MDSNANRLAKQTRYGRTAYFGHGPLQGASVDIESKHLEWLQAAQRAVNSHDALVAQRDALVAALRDVLDCSASVRDWAADCRGSGNDVHDYDTARAKARAALADAEGGQS